MNRWMKALLVVGMVAGASLMGQTVASADDVGDEQARAYSETMWYFVPLLGRHASEVDRAVDAVAVKPELGAWLDELAKRGEFIVYDLEGSPPPSEIEQAHERLVFALRQLNEAAQIGADDPQGARYLIDTYRPMLDEARHDIRGWLMRNMEIETAGSDPVVVVAP